jgi:hypothetical protein
VPNLSVTCRVWRPLGAEAVLSAYLAVYTESGL